MPFTFAHPAIILPFGKLKHPSLLMSALVIGSITPDFEYFIRMKLTGRFGHTLPGMFLLDLPVAIVLALIFHQVVKGPLIDNLPLYFKSRLMDLRQFSLLKYLSLQYHYFIISLIIGIASHIVWDSFTHSHEFFVERFEFLKFAISVGFVKMPLYRWLQHISTAVGFLAIGMVFHKRPTDVCNGATSIKFWLMIPVFMLIFFSLRAWFGFEYYGDVIVTVISGMCLGLIVSSIVHRYQHG